MKTTFVHDSPQAAVPEGFQYVGQDSYCIVSPTDPSNLTGSSVNRHLRVDDATYTVSCLRRSRYLYSDSATSCIILIVQGTGSHGQPLVILSHLSTATRFRVFFEIIDQLFCGPVSVFALGGTPSSAYDSKVNTRIVLNWMHAHTPQDKARRLTNAGWYIDQAILALGVEVPQKTRNGCAGIDARTGIVSTQAYCLTDTQRDPTGGVHTLFNIFGSGVNPPMVLHNAADQFLREHIDQLVKQARTAHWTAILEMTDAQILETCSSTPHDEVPWFCENLRVSARYVKTYRAPNLFP